MSNSTSNTEGMHTWFLRLAEGAGELEGREYRVFLGYSVGLGGESAPRVRIVATKESSL
jgi:hypothetical protein